MDGRIIPGDPVPLFAAGRQARVPFLIGTNSWDASLFAGNLPSLASVLAGLGPDRAEAERLYRPAGDDRHVIFEMLQDQRFNATLKLLAGSMQGHAPAYGYFFDYLTAARRGVFPGVPHGWELNYVFGSLDRAPALGAFRPGDAADFVPAADPASAEDRAMSDQIAAAWAAFATTGDPNVAGQPRWPAYDAAADTIRHFAREPGLITGLRREPVAFQMRRLRTLYGLAN